VRFGALPAAIGILCGVRPVVIAVVLQALWGLGRAATRTRGIATVGAVSLAAVAAGADELVVLFLAGAVLAGLRRTREARTGGTFTTATFIGYVLGGVPGAVLSTVGIFLPAFVFVALGGPVVPYLRRSPVAGAFLDGVNVASIALMAAVTARLARATVVDARPSCLRSRARSC
jgi:chromate transport protein ChrA